MTNSASAGPIIEQPQGGPDRYSGYDNANAAIGFDLDEPTRIVKVQMWMSPAREGAITASIMYGLSAFSTTLYSDTFIGESVLSAPASWQGLSSLKWDLQPGSYYLTFGPAFFPLALPIGQRTPGAKAPTDFEFAFAPNLYEEPNLPLEWRQTDSPLGVRIYGVPLSAVPEPGSYGALGGVMLLALAGFRRRLRTRKTG